jgi:membrane associated rhomboid family serine protease
MIFPYRDDNPSEAFPIVTFLLIIVNVVVFSFEYALGNGAEAFVLRWGTVPARWFGDDPAARAAVATWLTPITSAFLHADPCHLIGNVWFLWLFGDNVEDAMGRARYLAFYLLGGVAADAAHVLTNPSLTIPAIGSSGAISALMGAYFFLYPRARIRVFVWLFVIIIRTVRVPAVIFLGLWFAWNVWAARSNACGIAWYAHIGGFVAGFLLQFFFVKPKKRLFRVTW